MVEKKKSGYWLTHLGLILGVLFIFFPVWLTFVASTVTQDAIIQPPLPIIPGGEFFENYANALFRGAPEGYGARVPVMQMMINSAIMAIGITVGKIVISLLSAFAFVYFRFPFRNLCFWLIFITLMLPVEVRIVPTYEVVANLNLLNSYTGLIFPLIASATATFLFRQFFMTIPDEMVEAARMDAASEWSIYWKIVFPLALPAIAVLGILSIIWRWNDLILPMIAVSTTKTAYTIQLCLLDFQGEYVAQEHYRLAMTVVSLIPTTLVFVFLQRYITSGIASTGIK